MLEHPECAYVDYGAGGAVGAGLPTDGFTYTTPDCSGAGPRRSTRILPPPCGEVDRAEARQREGGSGGGECSNMPQRTSAFTAREAPPAPDSPLTDSHT